MNPSAFLHDALLVVGGASLDILHFQGQTARSAGGAGLYTALAAQHAGVRATMIAPRPEPMPGELAAAARLIDWRGPRVAPADLPTFEIAHYGGGRTEMLNYWWRAEAWLELKHLPDDLPDGLAYVIPLAEPVRQIEFLQHFKAQGRATGCGTYFHAVRDFGPLVRRAMDLSDVFFCNETEAVGLFGAVENARAAPGKLLFVTLGPRGAVVAQGDFQTHVPGVVVEELDPTGAGDTFCGTTLALLAQGFHPVQAAQRAAAAAAQTITAVGPSALLRPLTPAPDDARVVVDAAQVARFAAQVAEIEEVAPFSFTGELFPDAGHPLALDFFFTATLQQFCFWTAADGRYRAPMIAPFNETQLKGSDYLWAVYRRALDETPAALLPHGHAALDETTLARIYRDDAGRNPLPLFAERLALARAYGRDLAAQGLTPADLARRANESARPLQTFLCLLDCVGGYKEDPLRKKSALLAIILQQRPEKFLRQAPAETMPPVVDYHIQRSCLRTGLVKIVDQDLRRKLETRALLSEPDEQAVRAATYRAMNDLQARSGCAMAALDKFFFENRRRCPEMTEPDCPRCPVDAICAHRKELFQPVRPTTFY
jgi:sugar/nucleoside kinase (ribokinase family)